VRLRGDRQHEPFSEEILLDEGPAGVRQGVFLPVQRTLTYTGELWARPALPDEAARGVLEVGFRRRLGRPNCPAGQCLASARLEVRGESWVKLAFELTLAEDTVQPGEPLDFYLRWVPTSASGPDVLVDRVLLFPTDHIQGMCPDVIRVVRKWNVPLLRWPGGNFVSHYHWRDGVGPQDLRPTRGNPAWGGLEFNFFGTSEFIHFCRLVGAEPHIVVNSGTGTPEEAAAWLEYCNGEADTPMGKLRAAQGDVAPYNVRVWEVGNEIFGAWQGGYHGADENARRYLAFARAMRTVDPSIELIATGNSFDFVEPGPAYDHTHADGRWHRVLLGEARSELEYISLHCLPVNDKFLEHLTDEQAYYSLMAQPAVWERCFVPALLRLSDELAPRTAGRDPIRLAITEWGILGHDRRRPVVENYGEAIYAGLFLNFAIRNASRIPINNATALLHGGCVRKAVAQVYFDPQYLVLQKYTLLTGARPLACHLRGPGYYVADGPDVGGPADEVPYVDAIACLPDAPEAELIIVAVNRHLTQEIAFSFELLEGAEFEHVQCQSLVHPDPSAIATLGDPDDRFSFRPVAAMVKEQHVQLLLPPCSVNWITVQLSDDISLRS
jgi:alpha-N-arabinofuranosidase